MPDSRSGDSCKASLEGTYVECLKAKDECLPALHGEFYVLATPVAYEAVATFQSIDRGSVACEATDKLWDKYVLAVRGGLARRCDSASAMLTKIAKNLATDMQRKVIRHQKHEEDVAARSRMLKNDVSPAEILLEREKLERQPERQKRQASAFSDFIRELVKNSESNSSVVIPRRKAVYERSFCGQKVSVIAEEANIAKQAVYYELRKIRTDVYSALEATDPSRSLWCTLLDYKKEDGQSVPNASYTPTREGMDDASNLPEVGTTHEVIAWVIMSTTAFCPSEARLRRYLQSKHDLTFRDVQYHVYDRALPNDVNSQHHHSQQGCVYCQEKIDQWIE